MTSIIANMTVFKIYKNQQNFLNADPHLPHFYISCTWSFRDHHFGLKSNEQFLFVIIDSCAVKTMFNEMFFLYIYCFLYRSLHVFRSTFLLLSFTIVINLSLKDSGHNQFIWITCLLDQFTSKSLQYIVFQQFKVFQQFYQENCT